MMLHVGPHGWGMGLGWIIGLLLLVAIIWIVIRAVRQPGQKAEMPGRQSPLDILKERYARGEISREEFEKRKQDLAED